MVKSKTKVGDTWVTPDEFREHSYNYQNQHKRTIEPLTGTEEEEDDGVMTPVRLKEDLRLKAAQVKDLRKRNVNNGK